MIGVVGDVLLMLVLALASFQVLAPALARRRSDPRFFDAMFYAALAQAVCAASAMLLLMLAYAISDFSLLNVYLNSHTLKPLIYKLTGSWGNHEGSILLWMVMFCLLGTLAACLSDRAQRPHILRVQGWMVAGLAIYVLFTSSPFIIIDPIPPEGQGLNPLLQDIGLAMHPPMLYLGYVGFGVVFMLAVAALSGHYANRHFARQLHPWIMVSWSCLTIGIGLGSWWAYRELGWGGWWFWDPVENVSLLPWLSGTALLHGCIVTMKRGQMAAWTVLLTIITFTLSLMGTFLVRSGVLISVHSFASDPARGVLILVYVCSIVTAALYYFCRKHIASDNTAPFHLLSRSGMIALNHVFMLAAAATILLAIIYPMLLSLLNLGSITVGAPYYHSTVLPLMAPAVVLAGIAPLMHWQQQDRCTLLWLLMPPAVLVTGGACVILMLTEREPVLTAIGCALSLWLLATTVQMVSRHWRITRRLSASVVAAALAHGGFAVFVAALTLNGLHSETHSAVLKAGKAKQAGEYRLTFLDDAMGTKENFAFRNARVRIEQGDVEVATLMPQLRYYPERAMHTNEAAIDSGWLRDIYVASSLQANAKTLGFTLYVNPAMRWLWLGIGMVATGGLIAAFSRRIRL